MPLSIEYPMLDVQAVRAKQVGRLVVRIRNRYKRLWREAARVFIMTTAESMSIDTGMSVASLRPVAAKVQIRNILVAEFSGFGPKRTGYEPDNGTKSMRRGEEFGRKAFTISYGTPNRFVMDFTFQAVIWQHAFWDAKAWGSVQKGAAAMEAFLNSELTAAEYDLPDLVIRWFQGETVPHE